MCVYSLDSYHVAYNSLCRLDQASLELREACATTPAEALALPVLDVRVIKPSPSASPLTAASR